MRLVLFPIATILIWVVGCLAALVSATPVRGQAAACLDHAGIVRRLADGWGEVSVSVAIAANGSLVETFANRETGTWTITVTTPGGPTCLVVAGTDFHLTPAVAGEES